MIVSLEHRIKKLEGVLPNREFMSMALRLLRAGGYEELCLVATQTGRSVPRILLDCVDALDILELEEFRGLVPDEDIRQVTGSARSGGGNLRYDHAVRMRCRSTIR